MEHIENARYGHLVVNTREALNRYRGFILRSKDHDVTVCPCCGSRIVITFMKKHNASEVPKQLRYLCTNDKCKAMVPCYIGTDYPMGLMADSETISARLYIKKHIDRLNKFIPRPEIFTTLEKIVGRPHVAIENMSVRECNKAAEVFKMIQRTNSVDKRGQ